MEVLEAYRKLALLCSRREYCISDITQKMLYWKLSLEDKEKITSLLLEKDFIDESRFAEAFVKDKFRFNKWGKKKIIYRLKQKKISTHNINKGLNVITDDAYDYLIKELLEAKSKSVKSKDNYDKKTKLLRFMQQRGFEFEKINNSIDDLLK